MANLKGGYVILDLGILMQPTIGINTINDDDIISSNYTGKKLKDFLMSCDGTKPILVKIIWGGVLTISNIKPLQADGKNRRLRILEIIEYSGTSIDAITILDLAINNNEFTYNYIDE